jgi:hypothetical protein
LCALCCQFLWIVFVLFVIVLCALCFCFVCHRLVCSVLPVSLDCLFVISSSVFSNIYSWPTSILFKIDVKITIQSEDSVYFLYLEVRFCPI